MYKQKIKKVMKYRENLYELKEKTQLAPEKGLSV
jgi:hypothetical protein